MFVVGCFAKDKYVSKHGRWVEIVFDDATRRQRRCTRACRRSDRMPFHHPNGKTSTCLDLVRAGWMARAPYAR
eukprot:scaffold23456_cov29-Tisochrysis_lutea.AAC.2